MSNGNGHHWSKFCWRDWLADPALRDCSLSAKGFWIGVLGLMHEGTPVGHLTIGDKPATPRQMASNVNCTVSQAEKALAELEAAGVFSRTSDGTIYSRRMVRDAKAAEVAKAWGKAGGNPNLKARANGGEPEPPKPKGVNPPIIPQGYRPPNPPPLTPPLRQGVNGGVNLELEVQSDLEGKKVSSLSNLTLSSPVLARVAAACETPPEGTYGAEPTNQATQIAVQNIVGKLGRKLDAKANGTVFAIGKRPKLTVVEQQDAVLRGPVIDDNTLVGELLPPIRRGPVDPQRTVAEQLAALGFPGHAA